MSDRDPTNPDVLAAAVNEWLRHARGLACGTAQQATTTAEADIALMTSLLEQGVLSPEDVIEEFVANMHNIVIVLEDGEQFTLTWDGRVVTG